MLVSNLGRKRFASTIKENGEVANPGKFDAIIGEIAPNWSNPTVDDIVQYLKAHRS